MPPVGFEPAVSACERPQTYALYRALTGTGCSEVEHEIKILFGSTSFYKPPNRSAVKV
jgi:hypothetical protein